ncbi:MAG TPA: NAD(P)/FAD-dependent oxidoreductase [Mycobacteriales bacterium]|nr:NAD(P)/FAD-dependent oxidoreductase [Mycobacteriales bacterium]
MSTPDPLPERADVVVVGAGHNGLVAATLLARTGLSVVVLESADVIGGACRTERPFTKAPNLRASTGAYLLGLMPPELLATLDVELPLLRRDPHYFLPTFGPRHLLFGSDRAGLQRQFEDFFSAADWAADVALQEELDALRSDLAPAWLAEPLSVEDTAERYVRASLRAAFVDLCRGSVADYLARFGFASDLVVAMYAVTDGLSGLSAGPDTPGTGHNFLVHNMCRLPSSDGTWMIVRGGMGTVTSTFADLAQSAGAVIATSSPVASVEVTSGAVAGVRLVDGREITATTVLGACDPYRLRELAGGSLGTTVDPLLDRARRPGATLKVNLALREMPTFTSLPEDRGQHSATIHLLPQVDDVLGAVRAMWADVEAGRLPDFPTIEWYVHSTRDPSLRDEEGRHTSALFVQSVPFQPAGSSWDAELPAYVEHLLSICDRFAPGASELVVDTFALPPPEIERHFGITGGHIHHVDNTVAFADRMPYAAGIDGLYAGSAGCHPAGSVIGAAGHNAAVRILVDLAVRTT